MPSAARIVHLLDALTTAGVEAAVDASTEQVLALRDALGTRNVVGVGCAEKETAGRGTGSLALTFYVVKKLPPARLSTREMVPAVVRHRRGAVQTDVIALGALHLDLPADGVIQPGNSIGHRDTSAGTLGALVRRKKQLMLLSNSHVFALGGRAKIGDPILYPGSIDGGKDPRDRVATLARYKKFVTGGSFVNNVDCAIAKPITGRVPALRSAIKRLGVPAGVAAPKRGMKIEKVGRTTGKTTGTIKDVNFRFVFTYENVGQVGFLDQVLCTRYSKPGDSGSLVLDARTRKAVGLHFAGAPAGSVFSPIEVALDALGVELVTTELPDE